jgi:UDP-glucose 4-epimerase
MGVLITGGAGYIGSHTTVELLENGHDVIVIDNLSNSSDESIRRVEKLTGKTVKFYKFDLQDRKKLHSVFKKHAIEAVIHFAGLKAVGESVENPLQYYRNNIESTLVLLDTMEEFNVKQLVFSSSATVYGKPKKLPIRESSRLSAINPYGQTKLMIEQMLSDLAASKKDWSIISLRYFNPVGAHPSGEIGESPNGTPNNLLPYISQVASGLLSELRIFGNDYPTKDGTGIRDYIHVTDLAKAHLAALKNPAKKNTHKIYNIGTGDGVSVLDLVSAFENVSGVKIPYSYGDRREGDIAECYADSSKALKELDWKAELSLEDACQSAWLWQTQNPNGYETTPA